MIPAEIIEFLRNKRRFCITPILSRVPQVFYNGEESDPPTVARESVSATVDALIGQGYTGNSLHRLKALKQESKANKLNITLLPDLYLLGDFFCFVTLLLARERPIEATGWLPDRDEIATWCEGAVFSIGARNSMGFAGHLRIAVSGGGPIVGVPTPNAGQDAMWYDEFVRLPGYMAEIPVAWNSKINQTPAERIKYRIMAQDFVAFARNIMAFKVHYDICFQSSRIVFRKESAAA